MSFLNAASLLVVFSLGCVLTETEAVPSDRLNVTVYGNTTHASSSANNTKESHDITIPHKLVNITEEVQNHTDPESRNQQTRSKTALSGQENYGGIYKRILQTMKLDRKMEKQDLIVVLQKFGMHDCSRQSNYKHKVKTILNFFVFGCIYTL